MNITAPPNDNAIICTTVSRRTTSWCCDKGGYYAESPYNGKTHMAGACWVNATGGVDVWNACVLSTGLNKTAPSHDPNIAVGADGKLAPGTAQCTTWADFLSTAQRDVPDAQMHISGVDGNGTIASISDHVYYSSVDMHWSVVTECCNRADTYWHANVTLELAGRACAFRKDEAEKSNIYDSYWTPCIEGKGLYPVRLNNVTGSRWSAGYMNTASASLLVAAAAIALVV